MTKRTRIISIVGGIILVLALVGYIYVRVSQNVLERLARLAITTTSGNNAAAALVPNLLGFDKPRTMLVLFLNNTELRPGGGFIGSYGLVTLDKGAVTRMETEGTENLDRGAPATFLVEPPAPIQIYLNQPRWYFRDSNWSPDFAISAQHALQFYSAEGGKDAQFIETVVGITPEVLEILMKYTGPITVRGTTYTAATVTDLIEYNVEIEYLQKQIPFTERKVIISEIAHELIARVKTIPAWKWGALSADLMSAGESGHVLLYDTNSEIQKTIENLGWGGRLKDGAPDYLYVVDANLASLKTDRVIERATAYEIFQDPATHEWQGRIKLTYKNTGSFDWRTSRYRTYTRVYLPDGTKFLNGDGSIKNSKTKEPAPWDVWHEYGRTVVGTYFIVEPGETRTVTINVALAPPVVAALQAGQYGLTAQKQLGLEKRELTAEVNFGKTVKSWTKILTKDETFTAAF